MALLPNEPEPTCDSTKPAVLASQPHLHSSSTSLAPFRFPKPSNRKLSFCGIISKGLPCGGAAFALSSPASIPLRFAQWASAAILDGSLRNTTITEMLSEEPLSFADCTRRWLMASGSSGIERKEEGYGRNLVNQILSGMDDLIL